MIKGVLSTAASSSSNTSAGRRKTRGPISSSNLGDENNEFFCQTVKQVTYRFSLGQLLFQRSNSSNFEIVIRTMINGIEDVVHSSFRCTLFEEPFHKAIHQWSKVFGWTGCCTRCHSLLLIDPPKDLYLYILKKSGSFRGFRVCEWRKIFLREILLNSNAKPNNCVNYAERSVIEIFIHETPVHG
jgi:hypothetical protein